LSSYEKFDEIDIFSEGLYCQNHPPIPVLFFEEPISSIFAVLQSDDMSSPLISIVNPQILF